MKHYHYYCKILIAVFVLLYAGCRREKHLEEQPSAVEQTQQPPAEPPTRERKLQEISDIVMNSLQEAGCLYNYAPAVKRNNPYAIGTLREVADSLLAWGIEDPDGSITRMAKGEIAPQKLYLRFALATNDDLQLLNEDTSLILVNFPLDYTLQADGQPYREPLRMGEMAVRYTSVEVGRSLPAVPYEVLEELYFPDPMRETALLTGSLLFTGNFVMSDSLLHLVAEYLEEDYDALKAELAEAHTAAASGRVMPKGFFSSFVKLVKKISVAVIKQVLAVTHSTVQAVKDILPWGGEPNGTVTLKGVPLPNVQVQMIDFGIEQCQTNSIGYFEIVNKVFVGSYFYVAFENSRCQIKQWHATGVGEIFNSILLHAWGGCKVFYRMAQQYANQ